MPASPAPVEEAAGEGWHRATTPVEEAASVRGAGRRRSRRLGRMMTAARDRAVVAHVPASATRGWRQWCRGSRPGRCHAPASGTALVAAVDGQRVACGGRDCRRRTTGGATAREREREMAAAWKERRVMEWKRKGTISESAYIRWLTDEYRRVVPVTPAFLIFIDEAMSLMNISHVYSSVM
jgi:hypothetical protein